MLTTQHHHLVSRCAQRAIGANTIYIFRSSCTKSKDAFLGSIDKNRCSSFPKAVARFSAAPKRKQYLEEKHPANYQRINKQTQSPVTPNVSSSSSLATTSIDFDSAKSAHSSKSLGELLRAIIVFRTCQIPFIVRNAETLLKWSRKFLGKRITKQLMKLTFFGHFCAGESQDDIKPVIGSLRKYGIGGILDYAAEGDLTAENKAKGDQSVILSRPPYNQPARVYEYESEETCNRHVDIFHSCIHAVHDVIPDGFAALKVTALGNPILLERMSTAIVEAKNLFAKFDHDGDGFISREQFEKAYRLYFDDADEKLLYYLAILDPEGTGKVDYIAWSQLLTPSDLPAITKSCREIGPLALATPSKEEVVLMEALNNRACELAAHAAKCGVRLLIDAEHLKFQPAIDNLVHGLEEKYNSTTKTDFPIVWNTYQCYLKDSLSRMRMDVERAERFSYHLGAKLVRGAYMEYERDEARATNREDPIFSKKKETDRCYDNAVDMLLRYRAETCKNVEIMCATHNRASAEKAIALMNELGMEGSDSVVHFAQLYGMCDNLTYSLGEHGYRAYKYIPYGEVNDVIPYLLRRAQENSTVLGTATEELRFLHSELKRRLGAMRTR